MYPFTSCSASSRIGSMRSTRQFLPVRWRITFAATAVRSGSATFASSSLSINTRLLECPEERSTTEEAFGWSLNHSRGMAKMQIRINATTTSYCQDARAKSQKTNLRIDPVEGETLSSPSVATTLRLTFWGTGWTESEAFAEAIIRPRYRANLRQNRRVGLNRLLTARLVRCAVRRHDKFQRFSMQG
jgi:hypothetical protein